MPQVKEIDIYDPKRRKYIIVGHVRNGIFIKKVKKKHFCWKHHAFGLQLDAWSQLKQYGVKQLMFHYNMKDWVINMDRAEQVKIGDNLGHGEQYFIPKAECQMI